MSRRVGHLPHDCVRDELPAFHDHSYKYRDGDIAQCSCGRVWLVLDAGFCHYRELTGKGLRVAIRDGHIDTVKPDWLDSVGGRH